MATKGTISQVIGSTFDAEFPEDQLPAIYNAVKVEAENHGIKIHLTGEVQQHLGGGRVRAIALGTTDGLSRGMKCPPSSRSLKESMSGERVCDPGMDAGAAGGGGNCDPRAA